MAEDLWQIRTRKGMSVSQLAAKSGVPARLIGEYEAGRRSIRSMDLPKLAESLYVDPADIKLTSEPIPAEMTRSQAEAPRPPRPHPSGGPSPMPQDKRRPPPRLPQQTAAAQPPKPQPPPVIRPTQIAHLEGLARRLGMDLTELEQKAGKAINTLTRTEASQVLGELQQRIRDEKPPRPKSLVDRHRPYLPESVDAFELKYLTDAKDAEAVLTFTLFNGQALTGRIAGFSPYAITIRQDDASEVTIQKLAIAFYRKADGPKEAGG